MSGLINQMGSRSGVLGTISGTVDTGGKVLFKSTGKASGNPASGKTWVAFGSATNVPYYTAYSGGRSYAGITHGDVISVNTGSGFVDDLPQSASGVSWHVTLEYDNA